MWCQQNRIGDLTGALSSSGKMPLIWRVVQTDLEAQFIGKGCKERGDLGLPSSACIIPLKPRADPLRLLIPAVQTKTSRMFPSVVVVAAAFVYLQVGCFETLLRNNADLCIKPFLRLTGI